MDELSFNFEFTVLLYRPYIGRSHNYCEAILENKIFIFGNHKVQRGSLYSDVICRAKFGAELPFLTVAHLLLNYRNGGVALRNFDL